MMEHKPDDLECMCDDCCERRALEQDREHEGFNAARDIVDYLNWESRPEPFIKGMNRQHRTLQQDFTKLCVAWIQHLAKLQDGEFDGRNEASVQLAKRTIEQWAKDKVNPYLPHI